MLIILEGPDGAGKTYLANQLKNRLQSDEGGDVKILHKGPPTEHPLDEYENPLHRYRPKSNEHIICDRWHLGEAVYPDLLQRKTRYDSATHRHIDMFLQSRGAIIVFVRSTQAKISSRLSMSGRTLTPLDRLLVSRYDEVVRRYEKILELSGVRWMNDPRDMGLGYLPNVTYMAMLREKNATVLNPFTTYVGSPTPDVLFFGETRGVAGSHAIGPAPAFVPYLGTSGHYILSHLDTVKMNAGFANACDVDDPRRILAVLGKGRTPPAVVALGRAAAHRLDSLGVDHAVAPHPQYVRRFHNSYGNVYAEVLREAAKTGGDLGSWRP